MDKTVNNSTIYFQYDEKSKGVSIHDKIKEQLWQIVEFFLFRPSLKFMSSFRCYLLKSFGAKIGRKCYISNKAIFVHPWNVIIGNNVGIDDYAYIKSDVTVTIEDYVSIASFVHILPSGHNVRLRNFALEGKATEISYGAFIGTGAFIGPGVRIGKFSVVGSNTHVYKDVPDNQIIYTDCRYCFSQRLSNSDYDYYYKGEDK